jgi:hypothetical protein
MKISLKQILAVIAAMLGIVLSVYGMTEYFTPREVAELWISDLQKNQMQIQRQGQISNAQQWYYWYQAEVERLTGECARNPYDENKKLQLEQAKRRRDDAKMRWDRLMVP